MDLVKLLQGIEDLVVEMALWIILLPRTLWRVLVAPVEVARHFDSMQATPPAERDEEYLSPVLFWLLLAPVSLLLWLTFDDQATLAKYGATFRERLATGILMLLAPPLAFAVTVVRIRRERLSRRTLARQFALQCYVHAPAAVALVASFALQRRLGENIGTLALLVAGVWFCFAELRIIGREERVRQPVKLLAQGCLFSLLLMFAVVFVIILIWNMAGRRISFW